MYEDHVSNEDKPWNALDIIPLMNGRENAYHRA